MPRERAPGWSAGARAVIPGKGNGVEHSHRQLRSQAFQADALRRAERSRQADAAMVAKASGMTRFELLTQVHDYLVVASKLLRAGAGEADTATCLALLDWAVELVRRAALILELVP